MKIKDPEDVLLEMYASVQRCSLIHEPDDSEFELSVEQQVMIAIEDVNETQQNLTFEVNILDVAGPTNLCSQLLSTPLEAINMRNECGVPLTRLSEVVDINDDELHVDSTEDNESENDDEDVGVDIPPVVVSTLSSSFEAIPYLDHTEDFADESGFNVPGNAPLWNEKNPKNIK
ncbi:hypothetical protein KY284_033174 [Solanum tuberosum]|nr:hypothetical protein KY284_033174 [Solanum tuberosum]